MSDSTKPDGSNDNSPPPSADPEIEALLDFEPVPRKFKKEDGWTPPLQRAFIAELARHGSPTRACEALDKVRSGVDKLYKSSRGQSFRAAWDAAVELAERRKAEALVGDNRATVGLKPPFVDHRRKAAFPAGPMPGQVMNERGEYEDALAMRRRAEEAKDDEPWRKPNMRQPDMLLTAENGWMGDAVHGEDKMAELRRAMDQHRAEMGLEPIDWGESTEPKATASETQSTEGQPGTSTSARDACPDRPTGREANPIDVTNSVRDGAATPSPEPPEKPGPRIRMM
jgi:hypothetical protein